MTEYQTILAELLWLAMIYGGIVIVAILLADRLAALWLERDRPMATRRKNAD